MADKYVQAKLSGEEYRKVKVITALLGIKLGDFVKQAVLEKCERSMGNGTVKTEK